jgi:flagellar biogenesis protein FliO
MASNAGILALVLLAALPRGVAAQGYSAPSGPAEPAPLQPADDLRPAWVDATPAPQNVLPLKPHARDSHSETGRKIGGLPSLVTVGGSLAAVLGVFFLLVWVLRRAGPPGPAALPGEAFEVLGRAPLANRQQVHLLRCGSKLLLVSLTPSGAETLTEITDPSEVERLAESCRRAKTHGGTAVFRRVFEQLAAKRDGLEDGHA